MLSNEEEVGLEENEAIKDKIVERRVIVVLTKVWSHENILFII